MRAYLKENPHQGFDKMFRVLLRDKGCTRWHAHKLYQQQRMQQKFRKTRINVPVRMATRTTIIGVPTRTSSTDFLDVELTPRPPHRAPNAVPPFNRTCLRPAATLLPPPPPVLPPPAPPPP